MKVKTIKSEKNELELEFKDVDEGLISTIASRLMDRQTVSFAAFKRPHPLLPEMRLYIKTNRGNPKKVLTEVITELDKDADSLKKEFKDAFKKE